MDRFNALGRGLQLMLVGAVLLFIDLFLPWQDFADIVELSGWRGIGVIVGILTIVLVAWIAVRLAAVNINLPVSTAMIAAVLGALILLFTIIKMLTILDDEATLWSWIGLVLAVVIAVGAWLQVQAAGGMNTLKAEIPRGSTPGSATTASTAPPPAPTAPVPPAEPAEPYRAPETAPEEYQPPEETIERDERDERDEPDRI